MNRTEALASPTMTPESFRPADEDVTSHDGALSPPPRAFSIRSRLTVSEGVVEEKRTLGGLARHTLGIILLLSTVFLWTASNFLASTIFADDSFSKPYFVTYLNTSFFSVFLLGIVFRWLWATKGPIHNVIRGGGRHRRYGSIAQHEQEAFLKPGQGADTQSGGSPSSDPSVDGLGTPGLLNKSTMPSTAQQGLDIRETAKLSLEFSILWFAANYFIAACLEYTTVASSTILMSTSSIWTLIFGSIIGVEHFTLKKLFGVLASLIGIILISSLDYSGTSDEDRGSFPSKTPWETAVGNALALGSAVLYGFYTIFMKKRIGDEGRVDMLLFFGFVGLFNMIALWPGFFVLHFTGLEVFEFPPTRRIWSIVLLNSLTSLISDFFWAYAILLTSPLVVTVGLSLSIPLSLVGQMVINDQKSSVVYWIGAAVVFVSFLIVNHENKGEVLDKSDRTRIYASEDELLASAL